MWINIHIPTVCLVWAEYLAGSGVRYQSADWFPWQQQHACGSYRCVYKRRTLCSGQVVFYLVDKSSFSHSIILSSRWRKQQSIARLSLTFQHHGDVGDSVIHSSLRIQVKFVLTSVTNGGEYSASRPGRLTSDERIRGTHCIGASVDSYSEPGCCGNRNTCDSVGIRTLVLRPQPVTCLLYWLFLVYLKIIFKLWACGDVGSDVELRCVGYFEVMQAD